MSGSPHDRLAARARLVATLRRRAVAAAIAAFALAWGVIADDGSMGAEATTQVAASKSSSSAATGSTSSSSDNTSASSDGTSSSDQPAAVTTSQS